MAHKRKYAIFSLLLALAMCFSMVSTPALAAENDEIDTAPGESILAGDTTEGSTGSAAPELEESTPATSGTVHGSDIRWELTEDGVLLISGRGGCEPFSGADDQPWAGVREQIREVWFEDHDALSIEDLAYWFDGCAALTIAEVPYIPEFRLHPCCFEYSLFLCSHSTSFIASVEHLGAFGDDHKKRYSPVFSQRL